MNMKKLAIITSMKFMLNIGSAAITKEMPSILPRF